MVNFCVRISLFSGSAAQSNPNKPSRRLVSSCCSYSAAARSTSNFLAHRNLTADVRSMADDLSRSSRLRLTTSTNSSRAWKTKTINYHERAQRKQQATAEERGARVGTRVSVDRDGRETPVTIGATVTHPFLFLRKTAAPIPGVHFAFVFFFPRQTRIY